MMKKKQNSGCHYINKMSKTLWIMINKHFKKFNAHYNL